MIIAGFITSSLKFIGMKVKRLLQVQNISKLYGIPDTENAVEALNDVDFSIENGEFVAIMGPSGSGKTTLLNVISGIDKPTDGVVLINDEAIHEMSKEQQAIFRRQKIGFIFQDFNLLDSLDVKDNILLPMILEKKSPEQLEQKLTQLSELFGLQSILHKFPHEISGGQKQRVAISRALINEPAIIFADEPTGNLDSKNAAILMENLKKIVDQLETTILLVTHDVFAASYCQKVLFIKDGSLHSSILNGGNQQEFLQQIMSSLTDEGGINHDI